MILELDIGNTRIKWRLVDHKSKATSPMAYVQDKRELFAELSTIAVPLMVRMSSVRGGESNAEMEEWVNKHWSLPVHIARVNRSTGGVSNQYQDQSRLGVDRWLAMLAAFQRASGACVIIDSGTAFTIDVVDKSGLHRGGYILPGLQLMRKSLELNTRIRLANDMSPESQSLGNSTDSAVRNGTLAAQVSLIDRVVSETMAIDSSVRVFFAGGDAELLAAQSVAKDFEISPTLVLEGLAIACPYPCPGEN